METKIENLVVTRNIAAPVERVYQAWVNPEKMAVWFKPNERWRSVEVVAEVAVGKPYHITMTHNDGDVFHLAGEYTDVVPNRKLAFSWQGPGEPESSLVTVEFRSTSAGTEMVLTHERLTSSGQREQTNLGWNGCLDNLVAFVEAE